MKYIKMPKNIGQTFLRNGRSFFDPAVPETSKEFEVVGMGDDIAEMFLRNGSPCFLANFIIHIPTGDNYAVTVYDYNGKEISDGDTVYSDCNYIIDIDADDNYYIKCPTMVGTKRVQKTIHSIDHKAYIVNFFSEPTIICKATNILYNLVITSDDNTDVVVLDADGDEILPGNKVLVSGDTISVVTTPVTGYTVSTLQVDGEDYVSGTDMIVEGNIEIDAYSTADTYKLERTCTDCTITVVDANGDAVEDGDNTIFYGEQLTVTGIPDGGYIMTELLLNGQEMENPIGGTFVVDGDVALIGTATEQN